MRLKFEKSFMYGDHYIETKNRINTNVKSIDFVSSKIEL